MNQKPVGYDFRSGLSNKYNAPTIPTDRPQTPVFLMQMSGAEQYKQNLEQNLTGYLTGPGEQRDIGELASFLLPKDVNYYYNEREKVSGKVEGLFQNEKTQIGKIIDRFLEQVVGVFEAKRAEFEKLLDQDFANFGTFYEQFGRHVREFLNQAQDKLDSRMGELSNFRGGSESESSNPLVSQLNKLQVHRRRMEEAERAIAEVYEDYGHSPIGEGKRVIEQILVERVEEGADPRWTSVNKRMLGESLDVLLQMISRESNNLTFKPSEDARPKSRHDGPFGLPKASAIARMYSPAVHEKLNPGRVNPVSNTLSSFPDDFRRNEQALLSYSNGFGQARLPARPGSTGGNTIPFISLNLNSHISPSKPAEDRRQELARSLAQGQMGDSQSRVPMLPGLPNPPSQLPLNKMGYFNIYNQKDGSEEKASVYQKLGLQKPSSLSDNPDSRRPLFRPHSVNSKQGVMSFNPGFKQPKEPEPPSAQAVVSVLKTNILAKMNGMCRRFRTTNLTNEHSDKVTCFEIDSQTGALFFGTAEGIVSFNKVDPSASAVSELGRLSLSGPITFLGLVKPDMLLAVTESSTQSLFGIDTKSRTISITYKTHKERMKLVAFFDPTVFLTVTEDDRIFLYQTDQASPIKSFKVPAGRLTDICMASARTLFTGSESGDIRVLKFSPESASLSIEGSLKIDHPVLALEVFYKNEKLVLVSAGSGTERLVYVVNALTRKVMNVLRQSVSKPSSLVCHLTFTLLKPSTVKTPPEIYLVALGEGRVTYCDIDEKEVDKSLQQEGGSAFQLKEGLSGKGRAVKLLGDNGRGGVFAVGICSSGLVGFAFA
jgi:hypothetical protein